MVKSLAFWCRPVFASLEADLFDLLYWSGKYQVYVC